MIEVFKRFSKCNKIVNDRMVKVIEEAKINAYDHQLDAYYKNIGEILDHYYTADINWLISYRTVREFSILKDPVFEKPPHYGVRKFTNIHDFKKGRAELDDLFIRLTDEIVEEDLNKIVSRINRLGQKQEVVFWKAMMHLFNHHTHHRGQVSFILDQLKIENDYSNTVGID